MLCVADLIFAFNFFNTKIICSEIMLKGKLNCFKYILFLLTPLEETWVCKTLFFKLFIVIVKGKKSYNIKYPT